MGFEVQLTDESQGTGCRLPASKCRVKLFKLLGLLYGDLHAANVGSKGQWCSPEMGNRPALPINHDVAAGRVTGRVTSNMSGVYSVVLQLCLDEVTNLVCAQFCHNARREAQA